MWFKNDELIDFSYTIKTSENAAVNDLFFLAEQSDNNAEYRCEAWNNVNAAAHFVARETLTVYCKSLVKFTV